MRASKTSRIVGWILTIFIGLFMGGMSGLSKFSEFPGKEEMMERMGIPLGLLPAIAILEIVVVLLYLVPRTAFLGAILTTGYLGGAVFTHVRVSDGWFEILFPVFLGVLMWCGLALRRPILFHMVLGNFPDDGPTS